MKFIIACVVGAILFASVTRDTLGKISSAVGRIVPAIAIK